MKARVIRNTLVVIAGIVSLLNGVGNLRAQTLGEALNATNLTWTTGGDVSWFVETTNTYDGVAAAESGNIQSNQVSWLQTTVVGPATISYWDLIWGSGFFGPSFTINGASASPGYFVNSWNQLSYDLGAGTNVLRWSVQNWLAGNGSGNLYIDEFSVSPPRPLTIEYQPYGSTVYSGAEVYLSVTSIGTPPIQYQWSVNGTNLIGATNASFIINSATTNDSGIYAVIVTNSQGSVLSSNATVTVLPPTAPFFTQEPADTVAYTGENLQIYIGIDGSPPFTYQWSAYGTNVVSYGDYLYIYNVSFSNSGAYSVTVTNAYGSVASSNFALTVVQSVAPTITTQPRSLDVAEGVNTWMAAGAAGTPTPTYAWTDASLPPSPPNQFPPPLFPPSGSNGRDPFNNVTTANAGVYYATASNYGGQAVSQEALLTVLPPITNVATWNQDAVDIFVTNGLAFLARGTNGLAILSVTNPASPQLLGTFPTTGYVGGVTVSGRLAFLADELNGFEIVSVTNPSNPTLVGSYPISDSAGQLVVRSNLVYVADGFAGLVILNVSNPALPSLVGSYAGDFVASGVALLGNEAILSAPYPSTIFPGGMHYGTGFFVIDISDPSHPNEVGELPLGIGNLDSEGQNAFGISSSGYLDVFSITNPALPAMIGTFNSYPTTNQFGLPLSILGYDVRVANDLAYVAGYSGTNSRIFVVDARDATQPIPVGYYSDISQPTTVAVDGNLMFVAGLGSPMEILRTPFNTNPVAPPLLSFPSRSGFNLSIQGRHGRHYDVLYSDSLTGGLWQTIETLLLTNDTAVIAPPSGPAARFFRLKQDD